MSFEFIRTDSREGVFTITLCRQPVNVLHAPMMAEIEAALDVAQQQTHDRAVVITGSGMRVFSGGVEIADHSREAIGQLTIDFHRLLRKLQTFPVPTIAGLNGATLGGGVELALACHMMVCVPDAKIGFPEIKLASIAFPGILMLQGRVPQSRIAEMLAGGDPMDGTEAHRIGLVNRLVSRETFDADVAAYAAQFARHSRPVLNLMMRTLRQAQGNTLETGFDAGQRMYLDELLPLEDVDEGLNAYAQKRAPVWKHR